MYIYEKIVDSSKDIDVKESPKLCETLDEKFIEPADCLPKVEDVQIHDSEAISDSSSNPQIEDLDFDALTADFFNINSPEETKSSFDVKSDFDLMDGFSYEMDQKQPNNVEEQFDLNGLNDMLDGLISEKSEPLSPEDVKCFKSEELEPSLSVQSGQPVQVNGNDNVRTVDLEKEERMGEAKYVEMPRPKLTKCFQHIENKMKIKEEILVQTGTLPTVISAPAKKPKTKLERKKTKVPLMKQRKEKFQMPQIQVSPIKRGNINTSLISLVSQKNELRPLEFFKRLTSMDIAKADLQTVKQIVIPNRMRHETSIQRALRLSISITDDEERNAMSADERDK